MSSYEIDNSKAIVFDADVIIHFLNGGRLEDLFKILPNKSLLLNKVYDEFVFEKTKSAIDDLLHRKVITKITIDGDLDMVAEYARLKGRLMNRGTGESACMAYCRYKKDVIASSNLKDIRSYCTMHKVENLNTMDFVRIAYESEKWNQEECDVFIKKLVRNKHRIPFTSFADFATKCSITIKS
jgi:hypothetical protein